MHACVHVCEYEYSLHTYESQRTSSCQPSSSGSLLAYCHVYPVHMLFEILCFPSTFRELRLQICMTMSVLMWVLGIKTQQVISPGSHLASPSSPLQANSNEQSVCCISCLFCILSINYSITLPYPLSFLFSLRVFCANICGEYVGDPPLHPSCQVPFAVQHETSVALRDLKDGDDACHPNLLGCQERWMISAGVDI